MANNPCPPLKVIIQQNAWKDDLVALLYEENGNSHLFSVKKLLEGENNITSKIAEFAKNLTIHFCGADNFEYIDPEPSYFMIPYDSSEVYGIEFERFMICSANSALWHLHRKGFFNFEPVEQEGGLNEKA